MNPKVSIIMGSTSDWPVMEKAAKQLNDFKIPFEVNALSAHRTPELVEEFASGAQKRGIKVIIAGAGGAAHLPGVIVAFSGNENYPVGARYSSMGNTGVMTPSLWSTSHNQAGLAFLKISEVGLHYENKFLIPELGLSSLAFALPSKKSGTFGLNYNHFGYSKYNESK